MKKINKYDVKKGDITKHLIRLTLPSIGGFISITIFNLTDTYFVSRLGKESLAAMGFTFPVIMLTGAIAMGLSSGAASVLARAIGQGDDKTKSQTATYGILLAMIVVSIVGFSGLLTMDPLFKLLGAQGESLVLVKQYMTIWYLGCMAVLMPPVGDASLRASGDMVRPFIVMSVCALTNIILDPLLIFGIGIFPKMGIQGASLATVIARTCGMVCTLYFNFRAGLLDLSKPQWRIIIQTWKKILHIGIPTSITHLLPHLTKGIVTSLTTFTAGTAGVAALAIGTRIESFPRIITGAVSMALFTIMGQNWGSKNWDRIESIRKIIVKWALLYALIVYITFWPSASFIGSFFSKDADVILYNILYLRIILIGYPGLFLFTWTATGFNAIGKPLWSLILNLSCTMLFIIPGALIGRFLGGFQGMLWGLSIGQILSGFTAYILGLIQFRKI